MPDFSTPPSADDIHALAEAALAALPARLAVHVRGCAILIEEVADDETLAELGIEHAWDLTGLYRGVPLPARSIADAVPHPETVVLYREPILIEWVETGEDLPKLVASVLIHELAHHFGLSDAEIEAIEAEG